MPLSKQVYCFTFLFSGIYPRSRPTNPSGTQGRISGRCERVGGDATELCPVLLPQHLQKPGRRGGVAQHSVYPRTCKLIKNIYLCCCISSSFLSNLSLSYFEKGTLLCYLCFY